MIKRAVCVLTIAALCAGTSASAADSAQAYAAITSLESARSLGGGALVDLANGSDRAIALRTLLAIGRTRLPQAAPFLLGHVHDTDPAKAALALYGLGLIGRAEDAPVVRAELASLTTAHAEDGRLIAALDAVDRLGTASRFNGAEAAMAARVTGGLLTSARSPKVRARAAETLVAFAKGQPAYLAGRALASAFPRERDPYVRWHVMWAIYRGYAVQVPRALIVRALHDRDDTVRIEAVRALGRVKDRRAVTVLQPMLRDASWRVREQTLESIRVLQGAAPTEHLTAIPSAVQPMPVNPDPLDAIDALPRPAATPALARPTASQTTAASLPDVATIAGMTSPARIAHPRVRLVTTKGNLYVELYPEWAPVTVANFLNLAERGYFDGNRWFRIVPDFVVQTGDPNGNGEGDAGYTIPAEENPLEQDSYVISMGLNYDANGPMRDSAGTQFYVTLSPQLHHDRDFTVFGRAIGGFDVLSRLIESDTIVRVERLPDAL